MQSALASIILGTSTSQRDVLFDLNQDLKGLIVWVCLFVVIFIGIIFFSFLFKFLLLFNYCCMPFLPTPESLFLKFVSRNLFKKLNLFFFKQQVFVSSSPFLECSFLISEVEIKSGSSPSYFTRVALSYVLEELDKL